MNDSKCVFIANFLNDQFAIIQSASLMEQLCRGVFPGPSNHYGYQPFVNALKRAGLSIECVDTSTTENEDSGAAQYAAVYSFAQHGEVICYVKFQGFTSSYDDFDFTKWTFVAPSEKTVLEFN